MSIRAVLFDKDGTLIDFDKTWAPTFYDLMEEVSGGRLEVMRALAESCAYDLNAQAFHPASPLVSGSNLDIAESWITILGIEEPGGFLEFIDAALGRLSLLHVSPFDDLHSALDRLSSRDLIMGIATNDAEGSARGQLEALGIAERFAHVFGYDSGHGPKPGPGMIHAFCEATGIPASQIVMVGDSVHDMHAGRAAGARTLALTTGTVGRDILAPHADHVAESLTAGCLWIEANCGKTASDRPAA